MRWQRSNMLCGTDHRLTVLFLVFLLVQAIRPSAGLATNGLNLVGSGGISSALAGADTAVATDFSAMNTNPAGMTQIRKHHAGLSLSYIQPQLHVRGGVGNDKDGENDELFVPYGGYIKHIPDTPVTLGIGFFTVGGTASDFRNLRTTLGTTDKNAGQIRHYKLTPSVAYQVTDRLSLGISMAISYSDISLALVPNTVTGFETDGTCNRANGISPPGSCAYAFGFTPQYGLMYKFNDMLTFGLAYTSAVNLPYGDGKITRNQLGIGKVTYDAQVTGFRWADDLAAGVAIRPNKDWLVSAKFQWIRWDSVMNNAVINLTNGNNAAMPTDRIILDFQWRDQYVMAVGTMYDVTDRLNLHLAYNYGNNPVPKHTLNLATASIVEHHVAGGVGYKMTDALKLDSVFTISPENSVTFNSSTFGNNTSLDVGGYSLLFTLSYKPE